MSKINWLQVFGGLLGTAESIVPVFIHNPDSQKIEGVVAVSANNLFTFLAQLQQQNTAGVPTSPASPSAH